MAEESLACSSVKHSLLHVLSRAKLYMGTPVSGQALTAQAAAASGANTSDVQMTAHMYVACTYVCMHICTGRQHERRPDDYPDDCPYSDCPL